MHKVAIVFALLVSSAAWAQEGRRTIEPGMSREAVVAELGAPVAQRSAGEYVYLFYRNGCEISCGMHDLVVLRNGEVVDAIFRSRDRHYAGSSSSPREVRPAASAGRGAATQRAEQERPPIGEIRSSDAPLDQRRGSIVIGSPAEDTSAGATRSGAASAGGAAVAGAAGGAAAGATTPSGAAGASEGAAAAPAGSGRAAAPGARAGDTGGAAPTGPGAAVGTPAGAAPTGPGAPTGAAPLLVPAVGAPADTGAVVNPAKREALRRDPADPVSRTTPQAPALGAPVPCDSVYVPGVTRPAGAPVRPHQGASPAPGDSAALADRCRRERTDTTRNP